LIVTVGQEVTCFLGGAIKTVPFLAQHSGAVGGVEDYVSLTRSLVSKHKRIEVLAVGLANAIVLIEDVLGRLVFIERVAGNQPAMQQDVIAVLGRLHWFSGLEVHVRRV